MICFEAVAVAADGEELEVMIHSPSVPPATGELRAAPLLLVVVVAGVVVAAEDGLLLMIELNWEWLLELTSRLPDPPFKDGQPRSRFPANERGRTCCEANMI